MKELIKSLVESYGPSGFEDQIRELIRESIADLAEDIRVDAMGNLIAYRSADPATSSDDPLKIMIAAHMDEIGVMVTHITEEGFLRFTNVGAVRRHTLLGSRVQFANGTIGVLDCDRITDIGKVYPLDKYFIDVGATGRDDVPVRVGDAGGFMRPYLAQGNRLTAKSMDDRVGCAIAIETMRQLAGKSLPHDIYFVFSVQEEVGVRGAQAAANGLMPDVGIALDVTKTGDTPKAKEMDVALGKGPALKVKDTGMIAHVGLLRQMRERAESAGIPYQLEVLDGGSTDARAIQIAGPGAAAGCISIPCRYVHTASETVDFADVENSVRLLTEVLSNPIEI